jgi:uncharacterized small protein (DUF1192 family)
VSEPSRQELLEIVARLRDEVERLRAQLAAQSRRDHEVPPHHV